MLASVRPLAEQVASDRGLVVWDVNFASRAGRDVLTVEVDRAGGADSEAVALFTSALSRTLDEVDAIPGDTRYVLECCTPGAERKLRSPDQFAVCVGRPVHLTFKDGRQPLDGTLQAATSESVTVDGTDISYPEISQARLRVP